MKKRKLMMGSMMLLVVLLVAGGTFAWFTASAGPVVNEFKAGTLEVEIIDEFEEELAQNVNPGDCIKKVVHFKNVGTKRMYIRARLTPDFPNMDNPDMTLVGLQNFHGWSLQADGWYYHINEIQPGWISSDLIKYVCFSTRMGNEYQDQEFTLKVEVEAVQATNSAPLDLWSKQTYERKPGYFSLKNIIPTGAPYPVLVDGLPKVKPNF